MHNLVLRFWATRRREVLTSGGNQRLLSQRNARVARPERNASDRMPEIAATAVFLFPPSISARKFSNSAWPRAHTKTSALSVPCLLGW